MSDAIAGLSALDLREQIARIDRAIAENAKSQAETNKVKADCWFAPLIAVGTFVAALGGLATGIIALLHHAGHS